jgi:F0F1-type ATP synthase assembly protein I
MSHSFSDALARDKRAILCLAVMVHEDAGGAMRVPGTGAPRKTQQRLVLELLFTVLSFAILPVIIGVLLDWRFRTTPIITLAMMFLGFNLGIVAIYRRIGGIYLQLAPPEPDEKSQPLGGDPC